MSNLETEIGKRLGQVAQKIEEQVDDELERLKNLQVDDIQALREDLLKRRKARFEQEKKWRELGHGTYEELPEGRAVFDVAKKSERVVCHFYRSATERCKIVDHHLKILAPKHPETKFCKINAEKCVRLCETLKVFVMPTIVLFSNNHAVDRIIGFTDLGNHDEFKTEMLEWRLSLKEVIDYDGDKSAPPETGVTVKRHKTKVIRRRNLRGAGDDMDDSDEDDY